MKKAKINGRLLHRHYEKRMVREAADATGFKSASDMPPREEWRRQIDRLVGLKSEKDHGF